MITDSLLNLIYLLYDMHKKDLVLPEQEKHQAETEKKKKITRENRREERKNENKVVNYWLYVIIKNIERLRKILELN